LKTAGKFAVELPRIIWQQPVFQRADAWQLLMFIKSEMEFAERSVLFAGETLRLKVGQTVTSANQLSESLKITPRIIRSRLQEFVSIDLITIEKTKRNALIITWKGDVTLKNEPKLLKLNEIADL